MMSPILLTGVLLYIVSDALAIASNLNPRTDLNNKQNAFYLVSFVPFSHPLPFFSCSINIGNISDLGFKINIGNVSNLRFKI